MRMQMHSLSQDLLIHPNSQETSDLTGPISRIKDLATNPKYQRGRRITYGGAGSAAILAGILGTRNPEEEEQY